MFHANKNTALPVNKNTYLKNRGLVEQTEPFPCTRRPMPEYGGGREGSRSPGFRNCLPTVDFTPQPFHSTYIGTDEGRQRTGNLQRTVLPGSAYKIPETRGFIHEVLTERTDTHRSNNMNMKHGAPVRMIPAVSSFRTHVLSPDARSVIQAKTHSCGGSESRIP